MKSLEYNGGNTPAPTQEHRGGPAADCTKKSASKGLIVSKCFPSRANSYGKGRKKLSWRRQFGRFVADECGVRFVPDVAQYDPKRAEKRVEKRERLEDSDIRQCERFLQELIERPTIDPDQEAPVVIQGEAIPALKAAILQGLARASQPKGGR
ncbi:hypothetical protein [Armatimonas sp.]|uniref:hypothetical protein n=1 Tax=Armatimonas sp. TaxID=1872638 RepID=UPI003752D7AD